MFVFNKLVQINLQLFPILTSLHSTSAKPRLLMEPLGPQAQPFWTIFRVKQ